MQSTPGEGIRRAAYICLPGPEVSEQGEAFRRSHEVAAHRTAAPPRVSAQCRDPFRLVRWVGRQSVAAGEGKCA